MVSIQSSATSSLQDIRDAGELFDVTLVCDDGKQLEAHKVILSANSAVFRQMLTRNSHPHPLVFLPEQNSQKLQELFDFLYKGEVEVLEEEVTEFLKLARKLQVKGLEEDGTESDSNANKKISREIAHKSTHVYSKHIKSYDIKVEDITPIVEDNIDDNSEMDQSRERGKTEEKKEREERKNMEISTSPPSQPASTGVLQFTCNYCKITFKSYHLMKAHMCTGHIDIKTEERKKYMEEKSLPTETMDQLNTQEILSNEELSTAPNYNLVKIHIEDVRRQLEENITELNVGEENYEKKVVTVKDVLNSLIRSKDSLKECTICGKITSNYGHAREHAEIHIEGLRYPCRECGKSLGTSSGMRQHKKAHNLKRK